MCKVENNNRDGYYLIITKKRFETALKNKRELMNSFEKKLLSSSSTTYKLTNAAIIKESNNIAEYSQQISQVVLSHYKEFVINYINSTVNMLDLIQHNSTNYPENIAVEFDNRTISYKELDVLIDFIW